MASFQLHSGPHPQPLLPTRFRDRASAAARFARTFVIALAVTTLVASSCSASDDSVTEARTEIPAEATSTNSAGQTADDEVLETDDTADNSATETEDAEVQPTSEPSGDESASLSEPQLLPAEEVVAETLTVEVLERIEHDRHAFSQGLELVDGRMFESTGSPAAFFPNSTTSIREVDPATGEVLKVRDFGTDYFGEGLTLVDNSIIQLSWQKGTAYVFDRDSFEITGEFSYNTEGWGLCHDGEQFVMSDGSGTLYFRNTETFALEDQRSVLRNGVPVTRLNELECANGEVWANIWYGNEILRIDPKNGAVTGVADLAAIAQPFTAVHSENVLNGIAFDDATDNFIVTGKRWNEMLRVEFTVDG